MADEQEFERAADLELHRLFTAIEALSHGAGGLDLEVELQMGILTIEFPDGGEYIVNSHRAARQIWMAADRTAWHFDLEGDRWVAKKTNEELTATLEHVLTKKTGKPSKLR